jgi:hypothetical protein
MKKKKIKKRILVKGPEVSDPTVIKKLDDERKKVVYQTEELKRKQERIRENPYGSMDLTASVAEMFALMHTIKRKSRG